MKKIIMLAILLSGYGRLMAQNPLVTPPALEPGIFLQPFKADTSWHINPQQLTDSNKILQQLTIGKLDDFKVNRLINTSTALTYSPVDHMPVVNLKGNAKMPSVSLRGDDKMQVVGMPGLKKKFNP